MGWDFKGQAWVKDVLGPGSPLQLMSPPRWKALGHTSRMRKSLGPAVELTWSLVLSSSSSLSSSRLRLMRSRRRFSTSGFSICDQRGRESGPTGPGLSAATRASDPAAGKAHASLSPRVPGRLGLLRASIHSSCLLPSALASGSEARPHFSRLPAPAPSVFRFLLSPVWDSPLSTSLSCVVSLSVNQ